MLPARLQILCFFSVGYTSTSLCILHACRSLRVSAVVSPFSVGKYEQGYYFVVRFAHFVFVSCLYIFICLLCKNLLSGDWAPQFTPSEQLCIHNELTRMAGKSRRRGKKSSKKQLSWSTGEVFALGIGAVALTAAVSYFVWKVWSSASSEERPSAADRVQAVTGFTPALFDVSPEEQAKLDAWQPPPEGMERTSRAEDYYSRRSAQRVAAARAAAEAAETAGDD